MGLSPRTWVSAAMMALWAITGPTAATADPSEGSMEVLRWLEGVEMEATGGSHRRLQMISALNSATAVTNSATQQLGTATQSLGNTANVLTKTAEGLLNPSMNGMNSMSSGVNTATGLLNAFTGSVSGDPSMASATSTASSPGVLAGVPVSDGVKRPKVAPNNTRICSNTIRLDIQSFTEYRVYVEGQQVGYSPGIQYQSYFTQVNYSDPITIAIEATRDPAMSNFNLVDGLFLNVTICNRTFISDFNWVCTDTRPAFNNWRLTGYPVDKWMQAAINREVPVQDVYTPHAYWIWSKSCSAAMGPSTTSFCRATIQHQCKKTCGPAPKIQDYSCYSKCDTLSASGGTCAQVAARLAKPCTACSQDVVNSVREYCKTSGCTPAQCGVAADAPPTPDTSCAAACNSGVSNIREPCDQQNYMFSSGCLSQCAPEAYQYLTDQCVTSLKCGDTVCQVTNSTSAPRTAGGTAEADQTPRGTPESTPDLSCFAGCLRGMNGFTSYCDKINYALNNNCNRCSADVIAWAHGACAAYTDPNTGATCTAEQCA